MGTENSQAAGNAQGTGNTQGTGNAQAAENAQAAGYRYWSFWESDGGTWTYATEGPATARPADGTVTGFRFSVSADSADASRPRRAADFTAICGATPERDGHKRIAVVVDPGTAADAPAGERPPALRAGCARLGEDATAAEALAAVAKPLRYSGEALLCAISGYPASGCGEQVAERDTDATSAPTTTPAPTNDTNDTTAPAPGEGSGDPKAGTGAGTNAGADAGTAARDTAEDGSDDGGGPAVGLLGGAAAVLVLAAAGLRQARRRRG
ncbi:SCO2322 family protein [Streptomyces sp. NPDC002018]|uniref:SCO2322 family protein n=1 Tax=Streptomyces sp. NPDC002018 TaxID=3364629 RepID=UPI00369A7423